MVDSVEDARRLIHDDGKLPHEIMARCVTESGEQKAYSVLRWHSSRGGSWQQRTTRGGSKVGSAELYQFLSGKATRRAP